MENVRFIELVSHVQQLKAHKSQFFADIYQSVVVTACTDASNLRSGDFCYDNDGQTTEDRQNLLLYSLHMRACRVTKGSGNMLPRKILKLTTSDIASGGF